MNEATHTCGTSPGVLSEGHPRGPRAGEVPVTLGSGTNACGGVSELRGTRRHPTLPLRTQLLQNAAAGTPVRRGIRQERPNRSVKQPAKQVPAKEVDSGTAASAGRGVRVSAASRVHGLNPHTGPWVEAPSSRKRGPTGASQQNRAGARRCLSVSCHGA